jgi:hypothetical protein
MTPNIPNHWLNFRSVHYVGPQALAFLFRTMLFFGPALRADVIDVILHRHFRLFLHWNAEVCPNRPAALPLASLYTDIATSPHGCSIRYSIQVRRNYHHVLVYSLVVTNRLLSGGMIDRLLLPEETFDPPSPVTTTIPIRSYAASAPLSVNGSGLASDQPTGGDASPVVAPLQHSTATVAAAASSLLQEGLKIGVLGARQQQPQQQQQQDARRRRQQQQNLQARWQHEDDPNTPHEMEAIQRQAAIDRMVWSKFDVLLYTIYKRAGLKKTFGRDSSGTGRLPSAERVQYEDDGLQSLLVYAKPSFGGFTALLTKYFIDAQNASRYRPVPQPPLGFY